MSSRMSNIEDRTTALELPESDFYAGLTARNTGFVAPSSQTTIANSTVLIAGCGSIGGATVQPLARLGFTRFLLADNGDYELNNLNRQHATIADLGSNKAEVASRIIREINPHAETTVFSGGVTPDNAADLVRRCDVIVDGVDVTTMSGLRAKFALHEQACAARRPLVTGWDLAGMLCAQHFDYARVRRPFDGALRAEDFHSMTLWELIFRIVPMPYMSAEMLRELRVNLGDPDYSVPQLAYAAWQFGALASYMVTRILDRLPVPRVVAVDVHQESRPWPERIWYAARKPVEFLGLGVRLGLDASIKSFAPRPLLNVWRQYRGPSAAARPATHEEVIAHDHGDRRSR